MNEDKVSDQFHTITDDNIIQIHLLYIPLFLHWDDTTVVAQPLVNHRALSITNLIRKEFREKMQHKVNDFAEEMHAVVYELRNKNVEDESPSAPIFSTYVTNSEDSTGHELQNVEAIYPTVQGLKDCAKALQIQYKISNNSAQTIRQLFEKIINKKKIQELIQVHQLESVDDSSDKPNNSRQMQINWMSIKREIMGQPIRIALINGLQRCGIAAHLLGNKVLRNSVPKDALSNTYKFNSDSGLQTIVPLHLIQPISRELDTNFIIKCSEYSKVVQLRKYESFQTTVKAQLFEILASTGNEKCKDINSKRIIHHTFWTERAVSKDNLAKIPCSWKINFSTFRLT